VNIKDGSSQSKNKMKSSNIIPCAISSMCHWGTGNASYASEATDSLGCLPVHVCCRTTSTGSSAATFTVAGLRAPSPEEFGMI
jgi:hypothetical protein